MNKHSQGPWAVTEIHERDGRRYSPYLTIGNETEPRGICTISWSAGYNTAEEDAQFRERAMANARLIVAAPELLVELQDAASVFRQYERLHRAKGNSEGDRKADTNGALAVRFESVIAKALGSAA